MKKALVLVLIACLGSFASAATVAEWNFNDATAGESFQANPVEDVSGNGNTMYGYDDYWGPSYSAVTPTGSGLSSSNGDNHQDGYTNGAPVNSWSPSTWTIECSVNLKEMSGWETIIGRDGQTSGTAESDFYLSNNGIDDKFRLNIYTVGGGRYIIDSSIVPVINKWYGLAATSDGTNLTLYVDEGAGYYVVGSMAMTGATVADNALGNAGGNNWTFGRGWYNTWFVDHIDGNIDDIRFSDVALTANELIGIPEPTTMILLGLGALSLIKRKR